MRNPVRKIAVVAGALSVAGVLFATPSSAHEVSASGGQCWGNHASGTTTFYIKDNDGNDDDYCYINYNWNTGGGGRINHPQDYNVGNYTAYLVSKPQGATSVSWRVCKERQNDPDLCSSYHSHSAGS